MSTVNNQQFTMQCMYDFRMYTEIIEKTHTNI